MIKIRVLSKVYVQRQAEVWDHNKRIEYLYNVSHNCRPDNGHRNSTPEGWRSSLAQPRWCVALINARLCAPHASQKTRSREDRMDSHQQFHLRETARQECHHPSSQTIMFLCIMQDFSKLAWVLRARDLYCELSFGVVFVVSVDKDKNRGQ
jgi:hypothetical protein